eukprot:8159098-Pyramimonas_sp.AAC.3
MQVEAELALFSKARKAFDQYLELQFLLRAWIRPCTRIRRYTKTCLDSRGIGKPPTVYSRLARGLLGFECSELAHVGR